MTVCPKSAGEGEAEQETVMGLPKTTRLKIVCLPSGEPVTVIGWVPTGVLGETVKVMTEVQVGEQAEFEMEYEIPPGTPERDRVTDSVVPEVNALVMVF